jgi:hypothetical protein
MTTTDTHTDLRLAVSSIEKARDGLDRMAREHDGADVIPGAKVEVLGVC